MDNLLVITHENIYVASNTVFVDTVRARYVMFCIISFNYKKQSLLCSCADEEKGVEILSTLLVTQLA